MRCQQSVRVGALKAARLVSLLAGRYRKNVMPVLQGVAASARILRFEVGTKGPLIKKRLHAAGLCSDGGRAQEWRDVPMFCEVCYGSAMNSVLTWSHGPP